MIPAYQLLAQRIRGEVDGLDRCVHRNDRARRALAERLPDPDAWVDSAALNLHAFYTGLERLFELVAGEVDGSVPKGESWHRELLRQMTIGVEGVRPSLIGTDTADALDDFRRFRHVVRNVYASVLDPDRVRGLAERLPALWDEVRSHLVRFASFLEGVNLADDESSG